MNWVICRDADVPGECHTERRKSEREKQISYINGLICMAEIETQIQRTNVWISKGEGGSYKELRDWD